MPGNVFRSILTSNCQKADRFQAKQERGAKRRLHRFRFSGKIATVRYMSFPGFAGHRPAFHGGFCVSRWLFLHGRRSAGEFASWP
jgi:hypothetical protein